MSASESSDDPQQSALLVQDGTSLIPVLIRPWGSEIFPPKNPHDMLNQIGAFLCDNNVPKDGVLARSSSCHENSFGNGVVQLGVNGNANANNINGVAYAALLAGENLNNALGNGNHSGKQGNSFILEHFRAPSSLMHLLFATLGL